MKISRLYWMVTIALAGVFLSAQAQDTLSGKGNARPDCAFIAESFRKSAVVAEIGGNGGVYSINYQRRICDLHSSRLFWSAGLSVLPRGVFIIDFPVSVNWQRPFSCTRHHLILGTGQTLILSNRKGGSIRGTCRVAYRFNFKRQNAFMEFGYTPFYSYLYNFQWDNWVSASFGWNLHSHRS